MAERNIVDIGRFLQSGGLRVREHSAFGGVSPGAHSPTGYHPHDEAIDVTDWRDQQINGEDWKQRTRSMAQRFKQLGLSEVLGPGDKGHDSHLHLALQGKRYLTDQQLQWARDGRYQDEKGGWQTALPALPQTFATAGSTIVTDTVTAGKAGSASATASASATPQMQTVQEQVPADWKEAAALASRATDPGSQAYWQRQDMRLWAQANPQLAKAAIAKAGGDEGWLQAPEMTTVSREVPAASAPVTGAGTPPAVATPKPEDRGALNGTRVGGPKPQRP
jgi:hypothetical protein